MRDDLVYLSVSALNRYVEKKYTNDPYLKEIYLKGEVSNCKLHTSGTLYFSIKDENTKINAIKFSAREYSSLKDGDNIFVKASLSYYFKTGEQRLIISDIHYDSIGLLYQRYLALKSTLEKEGLFALAHKKKTPQFPSQIAVITAKTGAAIEDIKRTINRRYPIAKINVYSTLVQGEASVLDLVNNIRLADRDANDVIILARGGGSIEDLWSFNTEEVVRAVFSTKTPIITGVGHETDTTLVDYAADIRASTPTAAAEIATPITITDLKNHLKASSIKLHTLLNDKISNIKHQLSHIENSYIIKHYSNQFTTRKNDLENKKNKLDHHIRLLLNQNKSNLEKNQIILSKIELLDYHKNQFNQLVLKLDSNSPINIFKKGYVMIQDDKKERIQSKKQVKIGDNIAIQFEDGKVGAEIKTL